MNKTKINTLRAEHIEAILQRAATLAREAQDESSELHLEQASFLQGRDHHYINEAIQQLQNSHSDKHSEHDHGPEACGSTCELWEHELGMVGLDDEYL